MITTKVFRIFVASPGDVVEEVEALDGVFDEINRAAGETLGFRLELMRWDRSASPGVGSDPQQVINRQVEGVYDILVGVFWTRAGTPTPRAASGSIEEVLNAIEVGRSGARNVRVLVYFKNGKVDPSQLDIEQFSRLRAFKKQIATTALFKEFESVTSLESFLRVDLVRVVKEMLPEQPTGIPANATGTPVNDAAPSDEEDDLGLLDFLDINERSIAKAGELMAGISGALRTMTDADLRRGDEIKKLGGLHRAEARRILQRTAEDWNSTASTVETMLADLRLNTNEAFKALSRSVPLMATGSEDAIKKRASLRKTLMDLAITNEGAARSTEGFRNTIASYPRLIAEHNRAKRRLVNVLEEVREHFQSVITMANDIATSLSEL